MDIEKITHPTQLRKIIFDIEHAVLLEAKEDKSLSEIWLLIWIISKLVREKRIRSNNWNVHVDLCRVFSIANIPLNHARLDPVIKKMESYLKDNSEINLKLEYKKKDLIFQLTPLPL